MNERIQELARMSGFTLDETGTFPEFAEKTRLDCFAELIVRECAKVLWDSNDILGEYRIRKHFGVEL